VARTHAGATLGSHRPLRRGLVEMGLRNLLVEADERTNLVFLRGVEDIGLNLVPRRVALGPIGVALEGERVHVRLHVAGAARIVVVAPRTADFFALFEDQKVVVAGLA